jgi:uncharacterized protein YraI
VARGEICYGYAGAAVTATGGDALLFDAIGNTVALSAVDALATTAANPEVEKWGMALLALPAGLPEDGDQAVSAVLFGDAQIARPAQGAADRPTLTVTNTGGADANLRSGAGPIYSVVGVLGPGESALADGRNEIGDWVRIQIADGVAWVFARLIDWEGDLESLAVLAPDDMTPPFEVGAPFDTFTLITGESDVCGAAPSGLLLQYVGEQVASLQVNGVTLEFADATLLLHASVSGTLNVIALAGSAVVTAKGSSTDVMVGQFVAVSLGGEDGLAPDGPPSTAQGYALADVVHTPVGLLPEAMTCMVGLPPDGPDVMLRVGPGEQRGAFGSMDAGTAYTVTGWANDPNGASWWQLDTKPEQTWVAQDAVSAFGVCDAVVQVEPPPLVFAPPSVPSAEDEEAVEDVDDFAPDGESVWQMYPGSDQMSGECSGAPAINFCDHLAAISPVSGGITWKGMEITPYYLIRIAPNVYAYSGPNVLGTGTINMTLTFTSETALTMTQILVLSSEPGCQHTYYYTGTRNW